MQVRIDRAAEAVRLELSEAPEARRAAAAEGVAVLYDAADRIVGIEVRGVPAAALGEFTIELAGLPDRAAASPVPQHPAAPRPATPRQPAPFVGPVVWEAEAEAAVLQVPFFSRGRVRLAAIALARQRGLGRVDVDVVRSVSG